MIRVWRACCLDGAAQVRAKLHFAVTSHTNLKLAVLQLVFNSICISSRISIAFRPIALEAVLGPGTIDWF